MAYATEVPLSHFNKRPSDFQIIIIINSDNNINKIFPMTLEIDIQVLFLGRSFGTSEKHLTVFHNQTNHYPRLCEKDLTSPTLIFCAVERPPDVSGWSLERHRGRC